MVCNEGLEVASDLATQAFIRCLKRFIGRRGWAATICSNNTTNFVNFTSLNQFEQLRPCFKPQNYCINCTIHFLYPIDDRHKHRRSQGDKGPIATSLMVYGIARSWPKVKGQSNGSIPEERQKRQPWLVEGSWRTKQSYNPPSEEGKRVPSVGRPPNASPICTETNRVNTRRTWLKPASAQMHRICWFA